ncbi:MAG: cell envelope integrity protein TolA [Rhodoferax sp.]|nr:cell envelope integrity protein TolA [Rhodoferax sp.]
MNNAAALERSAFAPPPTAGMIRSLLLAIAAHGLLLVLLTAGVQWNRDMPPVVAEAELWSAVPEMAAPPPPPPEDEPAPVEPPPPPVVEQTPPTPAPDIALEKERKRKEQLALKEKADKAKALKEKTEKEKQDKLKREKLELAKQEQAKQEKLAKEKKLQAERKPDPKNAADARKLEELRQQNLKRMMGQASTAVGNGDANATGSAAQASGPSAGYAGRIRARIKPNIIFTDTISGNPIAEVEVRTSPDGTIISRKLTKPSGVKSWDDAVLNAIDKTEVLPRDVDGRVPTSLVISFRPRD